MKMTIFIVNIGQDPFTYRFRISDAEVKNNATVVKVQVEDMNSDLDKVEHVPENLLDSGCEISTSGMTDDVSGVLKNNATVVKVVEDLDKVEDNVSGNSLESGCEEISENSTSTLSVGSSSGSVFEFKAKGLAISSTMFCVGSSILLVAQPSSW